MKTITKLIHGLSGTTETHAMDLKVQEHGRSTWEFLATGTTTRVTLKSIFTHPTTGHEETGGILGTGDTAGADIQEIDLTQNVLTIVNFNMKLEHVRCTYDDDGGGAMTGSLYIKATTAK
jgi:hypothetical protein